MNPVPVGQLPNGKPDYKEEKPSPWLKACIYASVALGVLLFVVGAAGGGAAVLVIGLLGALAGAASIKITDNGRAWKSLWLDEKLVASPGIGFGGSLFAAVMAYIGLMALVGNIVGKK
ncbi:hypothetical protein [Streptomyces sp. NPDC059455]|uniref:hypothetical protein n=1 Tax=Streptomyces sp. NPDC059455 TaxID=3346837 RepID=UPI0036C92DF0